MCFIKIDELSFKRSDSSQVIPGMCSLLIWFSLHSHYHNRIPKSSHFLSRPISVCSDLRQLQPSRAPVCSRHTPSLLLRSERRHVRRHRLRRPVTTLRRAQEEDLIAESTEDLPHKNNSMYPVHIHILRSSGGGVI